MNIKLFLTTPLEYSGGFERFLIDLGSGLADMGHAVEVVSMDETFRKRLEKLLTAYYRKKVDSSLRGKETPELVAAQLGKATYYKCASFKQLRKRLQSADVIYSKNEILEGAVLRFAVGYKGLPPVIVGCHTAIFYPAPTSLQATVHNVLYNGPAYTSLFGKAAGFHVLNRDEEQRYRQAFPGKPVRRIRNTFDAAQFLNASGPDVTLRDRRGAKRVSWVGRLTEQKGIDTLAKIINTVGLRSPRPRIIWTIAGDGELREAVEQLAAENDSVEYLGFVPHASISLILKESDAFLSTSRWEAYPYNILEARCVNIPIVAFRIPGAIDVLDDYALGQLANNVDEAVAKLLQYTKSDQNPDKPKNDMCMFSPRVVHAEILKLLKEATA